MRRINMWTRPSLGLLCGIFAAAIPHAGWSQTVPTPANVTATIPHKHHEYRHEHKAYRHKEYRHEHHHYYHHSATQHHWQNESAAASREFAGQPGGTQIVYGQAIGTQVGNGGRQVVSSNGFASSSQIRAGGVQSISPGGTAAGTLVSGAGANQIVSAHATAVGDTLFDGGSQTVFGQAVNTKIGVDGTQTVSAGGVSTNTTTKGTGATQIVSANAKAIGSTISNGGTQTVYGQSTHTQIGPMARQTVSSGGVSTDASAVGSGAAQVVLSGGTAVGTNLASGATQTVYGTSIGAKLGCCAAATSSAPTPQSSHPYTPANQAPNSASTPAVARGPYNLQAQPVAATPSAAPFVMWSLFKGIPVGQQLASWGQEAGWSVVWSANVDPVTVKNLYYFNGFEQAAQDAINDLNQSGLRLKATFSNDTHTLTISQN